MRFNILIYYAADKVHQYRYYNSLKSDSTIVVIIIKNNKIVKRMSMFSIVA
jgi:hypothetical protein